MNIKNTVLAIAAALMLTAPAMAQTVSVGRTDYDGPGKNPVWAKIEDSWKYNDVLDVVGELKVSEKNHNTAKLGLAHDIATVDVPYVGGVELAARANLIADFGKSDRTGWSLEPTATFKAPYDVTVKLGYEYGEMAKEGKSRDKDIRTTKVTALYPSQWGNVGLKLEDDRGDRRSTSVSVVYVIKH